MLKKDTFTLVIVVVAAALLVVGVFTISRLWVENLPPAPEDFDGQTNYSNVISLTATTHTQGQVNYSVVSITASDVKWNRVWIAFGIGSDGHSWHPDLNDPGPDGTREYLGEWGSSGLLGTWKYWFNLTDADGDMCVSPGDFFTLETGGVASFEPGRTYVITFEGDAYAHITFGD